MQCFDYVNCYDLELENTIIINARRNGYFFLESTLKIPAP